MLSSTFELKGLPRALDTSRSYTPSWAFSSTFRKHLHSCPLYACAQLWMHRISYVCMHAYVPCLCSAWLLRAFIVSRHAVRWKGVAHHGDPCLDKRAQGVEPIRLLLLTLAWPSSPSHNCFLQCVHAYSLIFCPAESPCALCTGTGIIHC